MSILTSNKKTKIQAMSPLPVQLHDDRPEPPRMVAPLEVQRRAPRHPLAERAAEAAQYVIDVEAERDALRAKLSETESEVHFLRMTLEAQSQECAKIRENRDYLVGLVSGVKSRADMIAKNLLDLLDDVKKTNLDDVPPVSEYAPRPKTEPVDLERLSEEVMAEAQAATRDPLPEFLDKTQDHPVQLGQVDRT